LAEAIEEEFGVKPEMIEGRGGIFDVIVDGTKVWCKHDVGRFPEHNEALDKIAAATGKK